MTHTRKNQGVCSINTSVCIEDGIIREVDVTGGCNGNLKGVCALLKGRKVEEAIRILQGISCGDRKTSCPDQISRCLEEAIAAE